MPALLEDPKILRVLQPDDPTDRSWASDLERLRSGDLTLTRRSAGEQSIKAVQRLLVFLGYSTASSGGFLIDGDFGRGTNRGLAQFAFEHGLAPSLTAETLCYPCTWQTARARITAIPEVRLTMPILEKMLELTRQRIESGEVACGNFEEALFHLDALSRRSLLSCRQILERYGEAVRQAVKTLAEAGKSVAPEWLLAIIRQETAGIVRPRFEQHHLSKYFKETPEVPLRELRYRSMSFGLGQILGSNFKRVGAASAEAMFFSPIEEQVSFIGRFLTTSSKTRPVVAKSNPSEEDFETVARAYNGAGFRKHHYHESLARWFREFHMLRRMENGSNGT